jgi:hypothetical protein
LIQDSLSSFSKISNGVINFITPFASYFIPMYSKLACHQFFTLGGMAGPISRGFDT